MDSAHLPCQQCETDRLLYGAVYFTVNEDGSHEHFQPVSDPHQLNEGTLNANSFPLSRGNVGHGNVYQRPDGVRARCGGALLCPECARDFAQYTREMEVMVITPRRSQAPAIDPLPGDETPMGGI